MSSLVKREALLAGLMGIGALLVGFFSLTYIATPVDASQWLLIASGLWCFVWWELWRRVELNRVDADAAPYQHLGLANSLTLLRGGLIALTGGFLLQPQALGIIGWVPGVLYTIAAILDRLDGFVARRSKRTSILGSELDTAYDALGLLVAPLLAVGYGKIHWSFLLVSAAYYIFVWGLYWRRTHDLPVYPLMPSMLRRTLAGFQMGLVALVLLPCFHAPFTVIVAVAFTLPILLGFLVDWLVVSGRIRADLESSQEFFNGLALFSRNIFQPYLRVILCITLVLFVFTFDALPSILLLGSLLLLGGIVLLGLAGRVGAVAILVLLGLLHNAQPIDVITTIIIFSSAWLTLLGTGRFSLWQWDDEWVNRRDGEETL
ncbi:MAG: CDP-alcohol phosphatidyltransferase family protein [Cellvibrio sp.]|uniref:CDP-alcohol phosphatidyltransferase family protein n=1 Tax=Cellvibrio sp. TaxID=1965322 RepID=UPI0031A8178B